MSILYENAAADWLNRLSPVFAKSAIVMALMPSLGGQRAHGFEADVLKSAFDKHYGLITPPACERGQDKALYRKMTAQNMSKSRFAVAYADKIFSYYMITYDADILARMPAVMQRFAFEHECLHIQLGHTELTVKNLTRTLKDVRMLEDETNCRVIKNMRDNNGLTQSGLDQIKMHMAAAQLKFGGGWDKKLPSHFQACFDGP